MMACYFIIFTLFFFYSEFFFIFFVFCLYLLFFYFLGFYSNMVFFVDSLSFLLLFLTIWVIFLCIFLESFSFLYVFFLFSMMCLLTFCFITINYIIFFISFEFIFFFMFLYLMYMGTSPDRLQASFYMFFYTIVFSLPFLLCLLSYQLLGYVSFFSLCFLNSYDYFYFFIFFVFLVKLPIYGVHLWLPKAHVQASVTGSMLLAGVMLKLGGYGLIRFFFLLDTINYTFFFFDFFLYMSIYGSLLISFFCIRQSDLKMLIAYSSIVHMSVMLFGLFSFSLCSVYGSLLMMVSHGFISPMMFYFLTFIYSINHSRSIFILKGMIILSPLYCLYWFFSCFLNLSLPPFMSFFSEVFILGCISFLDFFGFLLMIFILFFTGVYCVLCYVYPIHGLFLFSNTMNFSVKFMTFGFLLMWYVLLFPFFSF